MTLEEVMDQLQALGNETVRKLNVRNGLGENQFGVKSGDIRVLAKNIKTNPELAAQLWQTGNGDAMMLASLLMRPKDFTTEDLEKLVRSAGASLPSELLTSKTMNMHAASFYPPADWLNTNVVKLHPDKESVREKWVNSSDVMLRRAGWSLTTERVIKNPDGLDVSGLLDRIEKEMGDAHPLAKWTMNYCLAEIGIRFPELRERAVVIGEKIGAFRDYPVSKGCTSPFAPIWISAMVSRQS